MKKRILSLILALCLVASLIVLPAGAEAAEENVTATTELCPCGCGKTLDGVTWKPWNPNSEALSSGHYYLEGNYVQNKQQTIMAGDRVVLDLRGNTITSKDYGRLLLVYGRFHLLDTAGGGRFMSKVSGSAFGGVVMLSTNEVNDAMFELLSGTITKDADNKGSRRGGLVHVAETATFRMTGGMLLDGSTYSTSEPDKQEPGGCVAGISSKCTIEILGGQIIGGKSAASGGNIYNVGTTILKNCKITGGEAAVSGGNVYQDGGSLTIENCVLESGAALGSIGGGGNVGVSGGAVMTIRNSVLRNGYSAYHGGNLYVGKADAIVENTEICAGAAWNRGGNIYGATTAIGLTLRDCQIPGDVGYLGAGLVLEGLVKIGLLNTGLRLVYGSYSSTVDASRLEEGSEIYVVAQHQFADASADMAYFKGANRTVLTQTTEGIEGAYAQSGELGGYCPHCGERVAWTAFSLKDSLVQNCLMDTDGDTDPACTGRHVESGHYYLGASLSSMAQQYIGAYLTGQGTLSSEDVVIDMAGYSITATGRAFYLRSKDAEGNANKLTLLDSYGGSSVTGRGANNQGGGVLYNEGSELTIYGGRYVYNPVSGRNIAGGGVLISSGTLDIHGGILDGSAFTYTDMSTTDKTYTYRGGAISSLNGVKYVTITAGRFVGGTAQIGGCAFFGYNNVVNITGGQFCGGVSDLASGGGGGCIRVYGNSTYKKAVFNMTGASVRDGEVTGASAGGGNLSIAYGTFKFKDCYIAGGTVKSYGGNMTCGTSGNITFTDCIIANGYSADRSGSIHMSATSVTTNWVDTLIYGGRAKTYGGNMTVGNGYNTIKGGQILFGNAGSYGGNVVNTAGNTTKANYLNLLTNDSGEAPFIASGKAGTYGGNIYSKGHTNMQAATIQRGVAAKEGQDLYVDKATNQSSLTVGAGVTGQLSVAFISTLLGEEVYGQPIVDTACDTLNATMVLEGNYNDALLCVKDGQLFVGAIAVLDGKGGYDWFTDTASAVEACDADSYVKLFIAQDVVLTKDCAVDICGQTVNVSGDYTLYGMDSSGDGYTVPTGKAVLAEGTILASDVTVGGKRYIAATDDTGATFHRLENKIESVSLRPSADGIYFTGAFGCDETLSGNIASYGVAVSTVNMPGADFMEDADTLYTNFEAATLEGGAKQTGVLISGIMKEERNAQLNAAYGQMPVFATAYLIMKDGSVILSDNSADHADDVAYSLYDVMADIDSKILSEPIGYRKYTNTMRDYFGRWEAAGMGDWQFKKINTPRDDGVIDVLMIGSSFCYYYVEEMVGLAEAAGIPMRVCNVYYSGCPLVNHYNWWISSQSNYQFFDTTVEKGRVQTNNVSLEWCLAQGEWDVISLQESTSKTINDPDHLETTRLYYTTLLNYLMEQFPAAQMMWHQPWTYQIGHPDYPDMDFAMQQEREDKIKAYCVAICEEFGIQRVNTGEAWQIVRSEYGYDNLCARLGKGTNHEGDYYHDGDIGGGQYLNACVWFEIITGVSTVGNTYAPTYKYSGTTYYLDSDITFAELQEAAHKAVEQLRAEEAQQ